MVKTYVITGATSGIGNALLKELAQNNIVFAGYRNEKYVDDLKAVSANVIPFYIDMENKDKISQAAAFIKSQTQKIDTLINVAGCVCAGAMENIDVDKVRSQFEVNTFSHLDLSQRLLGLINEGKIINISSMASFGVFPFVGPYCASKRAMDILFNSMSLETGRKVKIISIKPGVIATPLWGKSIELNKEEIKNSVGYENEMKYMISNAKKNEQNGLSVDKVVNLILKVDALNNPKPSYTVGNDAIFAQLLSKLPQGLINKIVKKGLEFKVSCVK